METLSDKIYDRMGGNPADPFEIEIIDMNDVKDFIKQLKENLYNLNEFENTKKNMIIDKLAGDKLI